MVAKTLRMGGVGLGYIGERRARILHDLPNVELVARAALDADRGAAVPAVPARWYGRYQAARHLHAGEPQSAA